MALIRLMEEVIPSTWLIFSISSPLRFPAPRGVPGLVRRLICMEKLLVMDPRLSDEACSLHRESDQAQGPHEENDGKEQERLGPFTCDISKSIAQHSIPSLLTLLYEATTTQFQDHIGGLCHFLAVGDDDDTFLALLGQFLQNRNDITCCLFV